MSFYSNRVKTAGWAAVLASCVGMVAMLTFKVNAVRHEVRKAEEQIVQLERDNLYLETEFETRASQQQLAALNRLEFGYVAPGPSQFLANERALVAFAEPRGMDAPRMIRVARDEAVNFELASFADEVEPKPEENTAEQVTAQPTFQRAVVEKVDAKPAAQPTFAALFAEYTTDQKAINE